MRREEGGERPLVAVGTVLEGPRGGREPQFGGYGGEAPGAGNAEDGRP